MLRATDTAMTPNRDEKNTEPSADGYPLERLRSELDGFQSRSGRFGAGLTLARLLATLTDCRQVKAGPGRQVYALSAGGRGFFLKISLLCGANARWRHRLLPLRRWAEWRNLHRLHARQLPAAVPLMRGQRQGAGPLAFFLLTEEIPGTTLGRLPAPPAAAIGEFMAALHAEGVWPVDLHPQNVQVAPDGRPHLIDAQQVAFLPLLPRFLRVRNMGRLLSDLRGAGDPPGWWDSCLEAYNRGARAPVGAAEVLRAADAHRRRRWRSRDKRCCRESTQFAVVTTGPDRGYRRRDFTLGFPEVVEVFAEGRPLKEGHIRESRGLCIKTHRPGFLHRDRCLAGWKMAHALAVRGVAVPRALAYFKSGRQRYLVSEFLVDSQPLNNYLSSLVDARLKRQRLAELARWLRRIHAAGIWQHDFKSGNVLHSKDGFCLVDLDSVRLKPVSAEKAIVNLAQLNASVSDAVTLRDRLRFFHCYSQGAEWPRPIREVYRTVWRISQGKNTAASGLDLEKLRPLPFGAGRGGTLRR
jgi:tRNA A-37 threonylcarbamoyl transferase component Bud32